MNKIIFLICIFNLVACANQTQSTANKMTVKKATSETAANETATSEKQASIEDTFQRKGTGSAYVFFVSKINEVSTISNAMTESARATAGQGSYLHALGANRDIPAKPLKLSLTARVIHSSPIAILMDPDSKLTLEGDIDFTPQPNMKYFVKGILRKDKASIWIEDINGNIMPESLGNFIPKRIDTLEPKSIATIFSNISNGESLDSVIRKLGQPDHILEYKKSVFSQSPAHDFTTYEYHNLGKIQFFGVHPKIHTVEKIISGAQIGNTPETLKEKINSIPPAELRLIAKNYYVSETPDVNYLDVLAEKIWAERNSKDRQMEDAVAYFCLTLGKSKNARYKTLFQSLLSESKSRKIQKFAQQNLNLLTTDQVPQFEPSTL
jgi:hypothetical protein